VAFISRICNPSILIDLLKSEEKSLDNFLHLSKFSLHQGAGTVSYYNLLHSKPLVLDEELILNRCVN